MVLSLDPIAIAGVTTAWSASTAAIFPLIAGAWNAVATLFLFGAAMEGEKHARIDRLDSLEFVHFLQTVHFPSCCVFPVSPEFLRMYFKQTGLAVFKSIEPFLYALRCCGLLPLH